MSNVIVPAPPRKHINWYRVSAWATFGLFIAAVLACAVIAAPYSIEYMNNPEDYDSLFGLVTERGGGWVVMTIVLIGHMSLLALSIAAIALSVWLLWRLLCLVFGFIEWWELKIHETDKRAKEHSGYHD